MSILPICYFPPVHWYAALLARDEVFIEVCQHYRKQQLTSRTYILVANRVLPLTIPVRRRGARVPIRDKKISFDEKWQVQHWRSISSAYRNSPFFEYYEGDIQESLMQQKEMLTDYLFDQITLVNRLLGIETRMVLTEKYEVGGVYKADMRQEFDPGQKLLPEWFSPHTYPQVFGEFHVGLSILDLLFNLGPEARTFLKNSTKG